jgi:hypothetical protein
MNANCKDAKLRRHSLNFQDFVASHGVADPCLFFETRPHLCLFFQIPAHQR